MTAKVYDSLQHFEANMLRAFTLVAGSKPAVDNICTQRRLILVSKRFDWTLNVTCWAIECPQNWDAQIGVRDCHPKGREFLKKKIITLVNLCNSQVNFKLWPPPPLPTHSVLLANADIFLLSRSRTQLTIQYEMGYMFRLEQNLTRQTTRILTFFWPCISVYLSQWLTNLMHKIYVLQ